jgi:hypothetical protein
MLTRASPANCRSDNGTGSLIEDAEATLVEASGAIANGYLRLDP